MIDPGQINLPAISIGTIYTCPPTVNARDVVHQTGSGAADIADCGGLGPALGVVAYKPTATSCFVVQQGLIAGFPPLTFIAGETLYMGASGAITRVAVLPTSPGTIVQILGHAKSDNEVVIAVSRDPVTL